MLYRCSAARVNQPNSNATWRNARPIPVATSLLLALGAAALLPLAQVTSVDHTTLPLIPVGLGAA